MAKLDLVGEKLLNMRINEVLPQIKGRLLDIGCGTNRLVKKYGNGIGVDVFQFGGANLIVKDTSRLPFDNESFDTITIVAALNHIPNRETVLKEMYRLVTPTGKLIITMIPPKISRVWHAIRSPWDRDQHERGMLEGEIYGMTNKEIKNILEVANFEIIKKQNFMFGINKLYVCKKIRNNNL